MDSPRPREDTIPLHVAVTTSATSARIEICGEVDLSNRQHLTAELASVADADVDLVYVDLRHLTFCDTHGCRALLLFERAARESGREVRIVGAGHTVRKVLCLLAAGTRPTFA